MQSKNIELEVVDLTTHDDDGNAAIKLSKGDDLE